MWWGGSLGRVSFGPCQQIVFVHRVKIMFICYPFNTTRVHGGGGGDGGDCLLCLSANSVIVALLLFVGVGAGVLYVGHTFLRLQPGKRL